MYKQRNNKESSGYTKKNKTNAREKRQEKKIVKLDVYIMFIKDYNLKRRLEIIKPQTAHKKIQKIKIDTKKEISKKATHKKVVKNKESKKEQELKMYPTKSRSKNNRSNIINKI